MQTEVIWNQADQHELETSPQDTQLVNVLVDTLTIADCSPLVEAIKQGLQSNLPVLLNISNCQEADTAGLQLLVAIQNDPSINLRVHWTKPSEVVALKAARLGVSSWVNAGFVEA